MYVIYSNTGHNMCELKKDYALSVSELPVEFCCMWEGRVDSEQKTIKWWGRGWIRELVAMWTGHHPSTRSVVWGIGGWSIEKPL